MVKIGDHIQCIRHRTLVSLVSSELDLDVHLQTKHDKNMVFLIEIGTAATCVSIKE